MIYRKNPNDKKKLKSVLVMLTLLLLLVACQKEASKVITYDSFLEGLEEAGYELTDIKASHDISTFFSAMPLRYHLLSSMDISIALFEGADAVDTESLYNEFELDRKNSYEVKGDGQIIHEGDLRTYTYEDEDYYIFVGSKNGVVITIIAQGKEVAKGKEFINDYNWD